MNTPSLLVAALAGLFLSSCTSFEREWKQSVADYQTGKVATPAGPWTGRWSTSTNGHTGNLRSIVKPTEGKPGHYDFRYHATWKTIFRGTYTVSYPVKRSGGVYRADGAEDLGMFGSFQHKAAISGQSFEATYSNDDGDLGAFSLKRPE